MFVSLLATGLILKIFMGLEIEEIDRSWMLSQKAEDGPFGALDHVGFNVVVDVFEGNNDPNDPANIYKAAVKEFFRPYLERESWARKRGRGSIPILIRPF